jgi:hypothetical protein
MVDLEAILVLGAIASMTFLVVAPPALVYFAAFVMLVPILGIALWLARRILVKPMKFMGSAAPWSRAALTLRNEQISAGAVKDFWGSLPAIAFWGAARRTPIDRL